MIDTMKRVTKPAQRGQVSTDPTADKVQINQTGMTVTVIGALVGLATAMGWIDENTVPKDAIPYIALLVSVGPAWVMWWKSSISSPRVGMFDLRKPDSGEND